jgi:pheromone shutdown-related protein TraB
MIMKYKNLTIIGTSHIAQESVNEVRKTIEDERPEIIALELDYKRYHALQNPGKKSYLAILRSVGLKGFLFSLIGEWAEKKLGKIVNVKPGTEMLTAIKMAKKENIRIALIDQDIEITLRRFSKAITWKEKFRIIGDIIKAPFSRQKIKFDLRKVPPKKLVAKLLKEVKQRYPNFYRVLVEERNVVMANNLYNLMKTDKRIMAVIGAGHEEELVELIKRLEKEEIIYL